MNLLLTGSTGFLGKMIENEFFFKYKVSCLSRTSKDYPILLEKDVPFFNEKFNLVIHAAGKAHSIPKTDFEKEQFYDVNVLGTLNLLKGLENSGLPEEFVFISSVSVYGLEKGKNIDEYYPLLAKDSYGLSKIQAEELVEKWCNKNQVICTILRLPLLVGNRPPGNLGAMIKAIKRGYYFNIGGGKARKSMVLTKDIVSFIPVVSPIGGIYNLTDGIHPSFGELSLAISKNKLFSLPLSIAKFIGKLGDILGDRSPITSIKVKKITSDLTFDDSKARGLLNWKPEPVLEYLKKNTI